MAEICIIYISEDEVTVSMLVSLLRKHWNVWWAREINHGDWEESVRAKIKECSAVVPVLSQFAKGERKVIIKDEMRFAKKNGKPIFPFLIGESELPFGLGDLSYTEACGWTGKEAHPGYRQLRSKLLKTIGPGNIAPPRSERAKELLVREKTLRLPAFVFSLSSHETQVTPKEGASLLQLLGPGPALVSAYDAWKDYRRDKSFLSGIKNICRSGDVLVLDSGNYEAYRKNDLYFPKRNPSGWRKELFRETALRLSPDLAFAFDTTSPKGKPHQIVTRIVRDFFADDRALTGRDFPLCPIIHLPKDFKGTHTNLAASIVSDVVRELDPLMVAIPERELGDGLLERTRTVRDIRKALDHLDKYYALHLLGTGNPLSMIALAAAGADSFDGLEWCRTVADYEKGFLFHFQQFEFFGQACLHKIQDHGIRSLIEDPKASYILKALAYNLDFFKDWTRTMQSMIHSGQTETLLKMVPYIGAQIFKEGSK